MISLQTNNYYLVHVLKPKSFSPQREVSFLGGKKTAGKMSNLSREDKRLCRSFYIVGALGSILTLFGIVNSQIKDTTMVNEFTGDVFVRTIEDKAIVKDQSLKPLVESIIKDYDLENTCYEKDLVKLANEYSTDIKELHGKLCDAKRYKDRKIALSEFLEKVAPEQKEELMEVLKPELKKFSAEDGREKAMKKSSFYACLFMSLVGLFMFAGVSSIVSESNKNTA